MRVLGGSGSGSGVAPPPPPPDWNNSIVIAHCALHLASGFLLDFFLEGEFLGQFLGGQQQVFSGKSLRNQAGAIAIAHVISSNMQLQCAPPPTPNPPPDWNNSIVIAHCALHLASGFFLDLFLEGEFLGQFLGGQQQVFYREISPKPGSCNCNCACN